MKTLVIGILIGLFIQHLVGAAIAFSAPQPIRDLSHHGSEITKNIECATRR